MLANPSSIEFDVYCLGTVDLNLLERDEMVCPDEVVTFNCTVFLTSLLRWNIDAGGSLTQISCFGSSQTCLGGGNGIHALITSVSSDPVDPDINNITSILILHDILLRDITTGISIECESQLTESRRVLQVLSELYECVCVCVCTM